jgi:putative acetyltransferase
MDLQVRPETDLDFDIIRRVNRLAFGQEDEGHLVDALRAGGFLTLSMVAELDGKVVAHVSFSELKIITGEQTTAAISLAPASVLPEYQRQGIGTQLIQAALERCRDDGNQIAIVVGHPNYYPRFGFSAELARPLDSPYAGDAFMALELVPGALDGVTGRVEFAPPFDAM